jgi:uncharacterized protein (DUF3084 family)
LQFEQIPSKTELQKIGLKTGLDISNEFIFNNFILNIIKGERLKVRETKNEKRETRNEKRETRNEKRETRNEKRETRYEKRESKKREIVESAYYYLRRFAYYLCS